MNTYVTILKTSVIQEGKISTGSKVLIVREHRKNVWVFLGKIFHDYVELRSKRTGIVQYHLLLIDSDIILNIHDFVINPSVAVNIVREDLVLNSVLVDLSLKSEAIETVL